MASLRKHLASRPEARGLKQLARMHGPGPNADSGSGWASHAHISPSSPQVGHSPVIGPECQSSSPSPAASTAQDPAAPFC